MSDRIDQTWRVINSISSEDNDYCVDLFQRTDGTYGFEEFRRDTEDMGKWTGFRYFSGMSFCSEEEALDAADKHVVWLRDLRRRWSQDSSVNADRISGK